MVTSARKKKTAVQASTAKRGYADLADHIEALRKAKLLVEVSQPINKDTEMHPLVRWQFRGGIPDAARKAFLFTNVTDSRGQRYDIPVVVGALATNIEIYSIGMGVAAAEIGTTWERAIANPITPVKVTNAPCQDVVIQGKALNAGGLDSLPIPISTPGFDVAPYLTAGNWITKDPETGVQNMGTYRGCLRGPRKLGVFMAQFTPAGGLAHWHKWRARGERMPCAVILGCPPSIAYAGPQKLPQGVDELAVAGGIVGKPIRVIKAKTVDLLVPADAEIVIEGFIDIDELEPEGPFGESHGYVALEEFNLSMEVTAITRKRSPIIPSIISQVTPSESSLIKRVAYEPLFLGHLRNNLGIRGIKKVFLHEPLTNLRPVIFVQVERGVPPTEVWRALYGAATLQAACGKFVIAVSEDIDPDNADAVFWSMAYRANPGRDVHILPHRARGHGPKVDRDEDATLLIDATLKADMPPIALPKREYMEAARKIWERLGLPTLKPEMPWFGYSLGDWSDEWDRAAQRATAGNYAENAKRAAAGRRRGVAPNTSTRKLP